MSRCLFNVIHVCVSVFSSQLSRKKAKSLTENFLALILVVFHYSQQILLIILTIAHHLHQQIEPQQETVRQMFFAEYTNIFGHFLPSLLSVLCPCQIIESPAWLWQRKLTNYRNVLSSFLPYSIQQHSMPRALTAVSCQVTCHLYAIL